MSFSRFLLLALPFFLAFLTSACGFKPLYGRHSADETGLNVEQRMALIRIDPIANRVGQEFHNRLRNAINPYGQPANPAYHLAITLSEQRNSLVALPDLSSTREDLILSAQYRLTDAEGKDLFQESARAAVSYNIFQDPYNDLSTRRDAHNRALNLLTEQIRNRVAVYLNRGT
jgi:LPS-assembly lipoprotein